MNKYQINAKIRPGLQDAVGKPVFTKNNQITIGKIIQYNPETGECQLEIDEQTYEIIMKTNFDITSREGTGTS